MEDSVRQEALFLFEARLNDIREWKQDQWRYTHVSLLALVGLFASVHAADSSPALPYRLLVVVACLAIIFLWSHAHASLERALARTREGLNSLRELLSDEIRKTFPQGTRDNRTVPEMQRWAVIGAAVFVILGVVIDH